MFTGRQQPIHNTTTGDFPCAILRTEDINAAANSKINSDLSSTSLAIRSDRAGFCAVNRGFNLAKARSG